jgi:catalase
VTLSTLQLRYAGADYQKANFLDGKGVKTPIFMRFSTVTLGREFPDLARNPRGFAIKFYTGEGNYDIVGLNFVSRTSHEQWHLYNNVIASLLLP